MFYTLLSEVLDNGECCPYFGYQRMKDCDYLGGWGIISKQGTIFTDFSEMTKPLDERA